MSKHTPTPWKFHKHENVWEAVDKMDELAFQTETKENAEHIVKCVM